jgi:uncharacterized SAM-binding protein YcdF (DUF218 family)
MHRFWKILKYVVLTAVAVFIVDIGTIVWFAHYRPAIQKADAIIILGAAINTPALYNRSLEGLRLYKEGKADVLVLSGGRISDQDISEAGYMQKVIKKNSQAPARLILDDQSHSTFENIKNSKALLPNAKSVIVVSDEFHLARAVAMARHEGFSPVYWSAPKPYYYDHSQLLYYYLRESVAIIDYIPKFLFK